MEQNLKVGYFVKMYPRLSETFIVNEILEMERRGVEVVIFALKKPDEGRFHQQVSQVRAQVVYLDSRRLKTGWPLLREHWGALSPHSPQLWGLFEELLAQDEPRSMDLFFAAVLASAIALDMGLDHIHAHFASTPSTIAYYASRITGMKYSFTAHAKGIFRTGINQDHLSEKIGAASFVSTVTSFNKDHISSMFPAMSSEKIKVVYNGIDLDLFSFSRYESRQPGLILSVGRLVPKKGFSDLIRACSILKLKGIDFKCVIIGDGDQRGQLEAMISESGLDDSVTLLGALTQAEVRDHLTRASVFALPCTVDPDGNQDALPTVLLEALAMGCPVVSTAISGVPEIVDTGVDGLLVAPGDRAALSESLETILAAPALAEEFALRGRQKVEDRFDVKKNVSLLEGHFRQSVQIGVPQTNGVQMTVGGDA